MASLRGIQQDMLLLQDIETREALLMSTQMVRFLEELRYLIMLVAQMGRLLEKVGEFQC